MFNLENKKVLSTLDLTVKSAIKKMQEEGTTRARKDASRILYLRPSSFRFNYCQLRTFFSAREAAHTSTHELMPFAKSYFVRMGTTAHEVWQEAMFRAGVHILYDWKCLDCGHKQHRKEALKRCTKCKSKRIITDEVEIDFMGVRGHVDCLLVVTDPNTKEKAYIVVDFKTTSKAAIAKKRTQPDEQYLAQIQAYCRTLSLEGLNILGWSLVFFTRDNPFLVEVVSGTDVNITKKQIKTWGRQHQSVMNATDWKEIQSYVLERPCHSPEEVKDKMISCPFATFCVHGDSACAKHAKESYKQMKPQLPIREWLERKEKESGHQVEA